MLPFVFDFLHQLLESLVPSVAPITSVFPLFGVSLPLIAFVFLLLRLMLLTTVRIGIVLNYELRTRFLACLSCWFLWFVSGFGRLLGLLQAITKLG